MKRAIFAKATVAVAVGLLCVAGAGCSPPANPQVKEGQDLSMTDGWTRPPTIRSVQRIPGGLIFTGQAEPGARVVLRSESGPAYAAAADDEGRFEIRMNTPTEHLLLRPETQMGQDASPAPERLLIVAGGRGPVAILRVGGATRRLDRAPMLGAVDSDGQMRLVSGRSEPSGPPIDLVAGGETGRVVPDGTGRWSLVLTPSAGRDEIRVGQRTFIWPGEGTEGGLAGDTGMRVDRAGAGWRVVWGGPAGIRQTTWLPDGG